MVGNSHLAALKSGWQQICGEFPDIEIAMFGASGSSFFDIDVRDGHFVADSERAATSFVRTGGADTVAIDDFDVVVLVGAGLSIKDTLTTLSTHVPYELMSQRYSISVLTEGRSRTKMNWTTLRGVYRHLRLAVLRLLGDRFPRRYQLRVRTKMAKHPIISDSLFEAALRGTVAASHVGKLVGKLASDSELPVYYVPTPRPSDLVAHLQAGSLLTRADEDGWGQVIARQADEAVIDALDGMARVIPQPPETIHRSLFTHRIYSRGSSRLHDDGSVHADFDSVHMNEIYGSLVLRDLIDQIRNVRRAPAAADRPDLT